MAALIYDSHGIISWGWNHQGDSGYGTHAEQHAISRANRSRLKNATIIVAGIRKRNFVYALPCKEKCFPLIQKVGISRIEFFSKTHWVELELYND